MKKHTHSRRRLVRRTVASVPMSAALTFPIAGGAAAADSEFEEKPAKESEVTLPPFPQAENLLPFEGSATTDNKYMVDSESLSVGNDGVATALAGLVGALIVFGAAVLFSRLLVRRELDATKSVG